MDDSEIAALRAEVAWLRARIAELEPPSLSRILGSEIGSTFTAAEVMVEAGRQTREAESEGRSVPELPAALSAAGIGNARSLAKWLPDNGYRVVATSGGAGIWAPKAPDEI